LSLQPYQDNLYHTGRQDTTWETGKTWGLRSYNKVWSVSGGLFTIILRKGVPNSPKPRPIGPNPVLIPPVIPKPATAPPMTPRSATAVQERHSPGIYSHTKSLPFSHYPIWELTTKTFEVLNSSQPNLTKECWLCLNAQPPFYTGVAIMGNHTRVNLTQCSWGLNSKLSLQQVTGAGTCVQFLKAQLPIGLCNQTIDISNNTYYSATSGWWACSIGLTPCIHGTVLNKGKVTALWCNCSPG
jgi:hypothetical protein